MEDPKVVAALVATAVSLVTAILSSLITYRIAVKKHEREYKLDYQVETLILKFLRHPKWRFRTFKTIKYHINGFEDNELRRILIGVGALRFEDAEGTEIWGLYDRVGDLLEAEYGTETN